MVHHHSVTFVFASGCSFKASIKFSANDPTFSSDDTCSKRWIVGTTASDTVNYKQQKRKQLSVQPLGGYVLTKICTMINKLTKTAKISKLYRTRHTTACNALNVFFNEIFTHIYKFSPLLARCGSNKVVLNWGVFPPLPKADLSNICKITCVHGQA